MSRRLIKNTMLVVDGLTPFTRTTWDILVDADRIAAVEPAGTISTDVEEVIDGSEMVAVPGFSNGHIHSWDHYIKGRVEGLPMELAMAHLRPPTPVALTDRQVYLRTLIGAIEALHTGATTLVDDLSLGQSLNLGHAQAALQAYADVGIRTFTGFSMVDRPIVDSWPFVDESFDPDLLSRLRALPQPDPTALLDYVAELAETPFADKVRVMVAPSAPHRCTSEFLIKCKDLSERSGVPRMTHLLETRMQVITAERLYGKSMVAYLDDLGFLSDATTLIHGVWLSEDDRARIAKAGATVQYNPWSNAVLGAGTVDFHALKLAGINVSMGTDGCGVTYGCSMSSALQFGACLPRVSEPELDKWPTAGEIFDAATRGGARALGFGSDLGRLAPGQIADIVLYRPGTALSPLNDPVRQIVYADAGRSVDTALVGGDVVMRDGALTRINETELLAELRAEHAALLPEFEKSEADAGPLLENLERVYKRSLAEPLPEGYRHSCMAHS